MHQRTAILLSALLLVPLLAAGEPVDVPPWLQDLGPGGVTILWHTATPACGWVEYGSAGNHDRRAAAEQDGMRPVDTWHRVRLEGLRPGERISYRVAVRPVAQVKAYRTPLEPEVRTASATFTVPANEMPAVRLLVVNDLHNRVDLLRSLVARAPDTWDAAILNGDCFADLDDDAAVVPVLRGYVEALHGASRPLLIVRGNHEIRGGFARRFHHLYDHPGGRPYFACSAGPLRLILPDCGEDKADDHGEYAGLNDFSAFRVAQAGWLARELAAPAARDAAFRVLVTHIPLHGQGASTASWNLWRDTLLAGRIDLALSGHTHRRALVRADEAGNPWPLLVGGGNTPPSASLMVLDADAQRLQARMLTVDGAEAFAVDLPRRP